MKVPKNLTEEQVFETINSIIDKIAHKYTFSGYDIEDIKQESFIICMDALSRYDEKRPLENFLAVNLSNRLKNFIRDNHYVKDNDHKKKVKSPNYITDDSFIQEGFDLEEYVINKEILEIIDQNLPSEYREDYLKMLNGITINKTRKDKIINILKGLLKNA